jgi:hypothetical protein
MSIPILVIIDNEFLALLPSDAASEDDTTVPLLRLHDIPSLLGCHSRRYSLNNNNSIDLSKNTRRNDQIESIVEMKDVSLKELGERQSPRSLEQGSFCIPGKTAAQIYSMDSKEYLVVGGDDNAKLQVSNACGYWVADFCCVGGFQQVLFLPRVCVSMPEWKLDVAKRILIQILHQCILTDGVDVFLPESTKRQVVRTPVGDSCLKVVLSATSDIPNDDEEVEAMELSPITTAEPVQPENGKQSAWMQTMSRALETRLIHERKERQKRVHTQQAKRLLLQKNQEALQQLLNPAGTSIKAVRMQYRLLTSGKGCLTVFMKVDVVGTGSPICALHLSCSPTSTKGISVRSQSGVVPKLQHSSCVTIVVIAEVEGIVFSDDTGDFPLCLNVEAHWTTGIVKANQNKVTRLATQVAVMELPLESLLGVQQDMKCIDYSATLCGTALVPSAVYECRKPQRLQVDISFCSSWDAKVWAASLNDTLKGTGHRIDLCHQNETSSPIASIVLFPFPEEELPGKLLNASFVVCRLTLMHHIFIPSF